MDPDRLALLVNELENSPLNRFADWGPAAVSAGPPGAYTIWRDGEFLYAGMSYRGRDSAYPKARGLAGRLDSHASGVRSGDRFNIYVCDRYVLRTLSPEQIGLVAEGNLRLDALTRGYIRDHLAYRFVLTDTGNEARGVEDRVRRRGLRDAGKPLLNPLAL